MENDDNDSLGLHLETVNGRMFVISVVPGFAAFRSGQVNHRCKFCIMMLR